jgi:GTP pyrophosphokinase
VFSKEKMNVVGVQTQSIKEVAWMTFTVEVFDTRKLNKVLALIGEVKGVRNAKRR